MTTSDSNTGGEDRLQSDINDYLARGGVITVCDSGQSAAATAPLKMTRQQYLNHHKHMAGLGIEAKAVKRKGVAS